MFCQNIGSVQFNKEAIEAFLDSLRENVGVGSKKFIILKSRTLLL